MKKVFKNYLENKTLLLGEVHILLEYINGKESNVISWGNKIYLLSIVLQYERMCDEVAILILCIFIVRFNL